MAPFKYLGNFWRTLEIPLINCEINLILICSEEGHCTKDHISQVLEYHGKLKKTK